MSIHEDDTTKRHIRSRLKSRLSPFRDPYYLAPSANRIKAALQMLVGFVAIAWIFVQLLFEVSNSIEQIQDHVLSYIGLALAIAAAIELAYTLFTPGPDEALNPLMLGVAAAMILQLGKVETLQWQQALAALLYVLALAGLFLIRSYLLHRAGDGDQEAGAASIDE